MDHMLTADAIRVRDAAVLLRHAGAAEDGLRPSLLLHLAQFQELTRYLRQDLVGVVVGNANSRGEIVRDHRLDTARSHRVWGDAR